MTSQHTDELLLDTFLPTPDFALTEHRVIDAPIPATYEAVGELDFTEVRTPMVHAMLWLRGLPARLRRRPHPGFTDDDIVLGIDWVLLGERMGEEIVLGAAGRFWTPVVHWDAIEPAQFAEFTMPRHGRIAVNFSVRPYGDHRTLLSHEVRVQLNDPMTRRVFSLYWHTVLPFARKLARGMLEAVEADALAKARG